MPISDEIIELEPVKKSKSKLIIMFIAMGVLLALAVTFLVLYLLKPNVEESTGRVNGVSAETSALFVDGDDRLAAVGNDYTVYVDVSAEGSADPGVNWTWEPRRAITEVAHGAVGAEDGSGAPATRFYFTFNPSAEFADGTTPVTITARSMSDVNKRADIVFCIVNQATEEIDIQKISHDNGAYTDIKYNGDGEISLPYYSNDKNNKQYTIAFKQLGKYNPTTGKYSDLTRSLNGKDGQPTYKVDIATDKAGTVISDLRVVEGSSDNESFRFRLSGAGTATITLTANNYNDFGEPLTKTVKIKAESTDTLGYIDDIRIYDKPVNDTDGKFYKDNVNKQYTVDNYGAIPKSSATFTIPYSVPSYTNFLQHIVILPLSIQYNADGTRKAGWSDHISVTSSLNDLISVTYDAQKNAVLQTKSYGAKNTCTLSVSSTDKLGVTVTSAINVNVVAQNTQGSISVKKENSSVNEDVNKKISTAQGSSLDVSVVYNLMAPNDVDKEIFITSGYLSKGYEVSIVSEATGKQVNDFSITLGSKEIEWGKQQTIDSSMVIAKVGTESSSYYTGTVTFKLTIPNDRNKIPDGDYTFTFTKIGTPALTDTSGKVRFDLDQTWSKKVTLSVTAKARTARFISESQGAEMAKLGGNSGNFVIESNNKARLYLQNRTGTLPVGFDFKKFVEVTDGVSTINVTCASSTGNLTPTGSVNNQTFTFPGKKGWQDNNIQGTVTIKAKNNAEEIIGEFVIDVYLIDAIQSISVEDGGASDFIYDKASIASGSTSFSLDRILNKFTFLQDADIAGNPDKKYNAKAHDNFELHGRIGSDSSKDEPFAAVEVGKNIEFRYPDKNGTTVFECVGGKIYPKVDLFEFSYNNNIDVTVVTIKYFTVPDARYETEDDVKSCSRSITFTRRADDVALFLSDAYSDKVRIPNSGDKFTYEINMGAIGDIYSSAVVNIKKTGDTEAKPVVVKYAAKYEEKKEFVNGLKIEDVYFEKPGVAGDAFVVTKGDDYKTGYLSMTFTAPQINGDSEVFSSVIHGATGNYRLEVVVLNRSRPIEKIELFTQYTDESSNTPLERLDFGKFGNTAAGSDWSKKIFFIKATFTKYDNEEQDKLYTQLEPVTVVLPNDKFVLKTDDATYSGKNLYDLVASKMVSGQYYYVWTCELSLADNAVDLVREGDDYGFAAMDKFADGGDNSQHIYASVPMTIATGVESIRFTVGGADHDVTVGANHEVNVNFVLTSSTDAAINVQSIEIPFEVITYANKFGAGLIEYDLNKLTYLGDNVDGLLGGGSVLLKKLTLRIDPDNAKVMNGKYVFTLTDTANGANSVFKITVNVTVRADIYSIEHEGSYTATTSGADSGETSINGKITYNNATATRQPDGTFKNKVDIKVVKGGTGSVDYVNDGTVTLKNFDKDVGTFTLAVANSVLSGNYALLITYSSDYNEISEYVLIDVKTNSNEIKWLGEKDGNVKIENGSAQIKVEKPTDRFNFLARVYNRGNGNLIDADTSKITYAVYDSVADRNNDGTKSTVAAVTEGGLVYLTTPTSASGVVYLRASYDDASSGRTFYVDVNITYKIVITSFSINDVDEDTFKNDTFILYYQNGAAYTTLDLGNKIVVATAFGVPPLQTPEISLESGDTDKLSIVGHKLVPLRAGTATLTIKAFGGIEERTHVYTVNIISIDALVLETVGGRINIIENESVDITRTVSDEKYKGLVGTFSVSSPSKINVGSITDNKTATVKLDRSAFGASDYKDYSLLATTVYALKSGSSLELIGTFTVSANYKLTVYGAYNVSFDVYVNGSKINENSVNEIDAASAYKVVVNEPSDAWYTSTDYVYSASDDNGIARIGAFASGEGVLTFDTSKAGVISITVTASAYGKSYDSTSKSYTFSYGNNFTTKLQSSSVGSSTFTDFADKDTPTKSIAVDHDDSTAQKVIRYVIDVSAVGGAVTSADISFVGSATADEVKYDEAKKQYYRDFTLDAKTTLILSGTFVVGGRTYVTEKYTVECTATEPDFKVTSDKSELSAADKNKFETATLSVGNSSTAFKGAFSVSYSVVAGSDRATVDASTGVLTPDPKKNATSGSVVVRATVTVTSGVFAGMTYTVDTVVAIKGVALPELKLSTDTVKTGVGSVQLDNKFELDGDALFDYDYTCQYTVYDSVGLDGADYELVGSVLTIRDTDRTKAGGKIRVQIKATVGSEINKGAVDTAIIDVVITPRAHQSVVETNVSGAIGSYDIKNAVTPYTYDMAGFVNSADEYTVVYTLVGTEDGISVSGDRLVISKAVTASKQITLNAKLTFTNDGSAYKGTTISVNGIVVNVCGFTFDDVEIGWQTESEPYGYEKVEINASLTGLTETVKSIVVTLESNAAFASIADNGSGAVVISVDNDFNIAAAGTKQINYSAVVVVEKNGEDCVYYGEGVIVVNPVAPELNVTINDTSYVDNSNYSVYVGDSFNINFAESHGFKIDSVSVGDLGSGLTCVAGGVNYMFTATAMGDARAVLFNVDVGGVKMEYTINITVEAKPTVPPFAATNTSLTLFYKNGSYGSSDTGTAISMLTPTTEYYVTRPRQLYVSLSSGYLNQYFNAMYVYGYKADGAEEQIGYVRFSNYSRYTYIDCTSDNDFTRYKIVFDYNYNNSSSFTMNTTFYWYKTSGTIGSSTSCSINYNISKVNVNSGRVNVIYDSNGGSYVPTKQYSSDQIVSAPDVPTKNGYEFVGWYTVPNPDTSKDALHKFVFDRTTYSSIMLYAGWNKQTYNVTYNGNGGTINGSNTTSATMYYGEAYVGLPSASAMNRVGYSFDGWWTAQDGGTAVTSNTLCTIDADHSLYAHWTAKTYTVTFNANNGTLDALSTSKTVTYDAKYGTLPTPTRSGYVFVSWHLKSISGSAVTNGTTVATAENHTLYAEWRVISNIAVTFNANGGSFASGATTVIDQTYNGKYSMPTNPTRDGYTFVGWTDADGNAVSSSTTVENVNAHTLYAKWEARTDISVKLNNGTTVESITRTFGGAYALPAPTREGYTFKYWYVQGGSDATAFTATTVGSEALVSGGLTLVAKWEANTYYVFLNYNDGTGKVESKAVTFGSAYDLGTPTRDGYTFEGWYANIGGEEVEITDATVGAEALNGLIVYAKWTENITD